VTISLVGTFGAGTDTGNLTATLPTGIGFGDGIGAVVIGSSAQTVATPAGWTVKAGWPKDGGNARFYAFVKDSVTAGDSGAVVTFVPSAGNKLIVVGFVLRSSNGFAADWTDQLTFLAHAAAGTSYTAPASTSTSAGDWGVVVFGVRGTSPTAWTPAPGLTERQDLQRAGSGATSLQLADSNGAIGGTGTVWGPFTEANINTSAGGALTWLVKEAAAVTEGDAYTDAYGTGTEPAPGSAYPQIGHWRNHDTDGGWRVRHDAAEAVYGPFQGGWAQYFGSGSVPLSAEVITAINDGIPIHVYWKPWTTDWAQVASGGRDTQLDAAAASIASVAPAVVELTIHHEPEDDYENHGAGGAGWTAANYRGMWQRVRARFDLAGVTNVVWVMAFMNSHSAPGTSSPGQHMLTLWGNDGVMDALVDVTAQQDYITKNATPATIATKWLEDLEFCRTNDSTGRRWSYLHKQQQFTEWGADLGGLDTDRGTNLHRAQTIDAIRAILPDLAARNVRKIKYFDAGSNDIDSPPNPDGVAYQQLKAASEAGQQAGPVTAAGVSLARDGQTVTSTTIPFLLPAGWQPGDYAVVWLSSPSNPAVTIVPAGWALAEGPISNSTTQRGWRYGKFLQAGEANPTWTLDQSVRGSGVMVVLRGVDPATPVHATAVLAATSSGTSHAAAAVTTTAPETHLLTVWLTRWADATANGGVNYATAPGTHTADGSVSVNSGANPGAGGLVAHLTASPVGPGTHGPYSATVPVASTGICGQLAILPATTPPPPPGSVDATATPATIALRVTLPPATTVVTTPGAVVLIPAATVQAAFSSQPMAATPVWTTLPGEGTGAVQAPLEITHGRRDEFAEVDPGTLHAGLRNEDGRYTMGKTTGPYGSGVRVGRRVRAQYTYQGVQHTRYDGHANSWPTSWPVGGGQVAFGELSASDRLKRLGQIGELRSMLEEETLRDAPAVYYPLGEPDTATSAGSITPTAQPAAAIRQQGAGGEISFGQGTGPGTDGLPAAVFTPAPAQAGGQLLVAAPVQAAASDTHTLSCWFATDDEPGPDATAMCAATTPAGDDAVILGIWPSGQVLIRVIADGASVLAQLSPAVCNDGRTHRATATLTRAGTGVVTVRLYVDGVQVQTGTFSRGQLGGFSQLVIGGFHVGNAHAPYSGTLSHVAYHPTALSAARESTIWQAGATGLAGERTDQRIARVADWIGLPVGDRALDAGDKTMGPQSTAGKQPLEVMREAARVEQGILFISPDGKLSFHRLARRYNLTTPALTLDCAQEGHVSVGLVMPGDDFGLVNDMRVSRPGGAEQRALNQDSINEYGLYRDSLEIPAATDNDARSVAQRRVSSYGTPRVRIPNLTVHLSKLHTVNPSLVTAILNLRISSLVRLVNLPTQAPGTTVDAFVEGWREVIDPAGGWTIELNCSPADHYKVWQLGRVGFSELGVTTRLAL
jgi:hypothetical protein